MEPPIASRILCIELNPTRTHPCPLHRIYHAQNLYLGPLVSEEELGAAVGGGGGSGSGKKGAEAKGTAESKEGREEAKGGNKEGDDDGVDRTAVGLEQLSTTGRQELDREDSAGGL